MSNPLLRRSIRTILEARAWGTASLMLPAMLLAGPGIASAQDAAGNAPAPQKAQSLETIVVTGSRIRRVDLETANPVFAIDRAQIQQSGKVTVGDLVQEAPSISGAAQNPQVNNGGGDGASTVSLRGLGAQRTLVLINGHRVIASPSAGGVDINQIPANLVERIEVLKDGASAVYGSDAIGGVVNIILRSNYQGAEFTADYGISDRNDGERRGFSATFGQTGDKGSVIAGINYNKFDPISSADRDYAKDATYLYSGTITKIGSSRNPNGQLQLPANLLAQFGTSCTGKAATSVTKLPGTSGTSPSDYRAYCGATDSYNYQKQNLILTPQERTSAFALANYQLTDSVSAYLDVFHNKTTSQFAIAPLPFDANNDAVTISAQNYYNPFGDRVLGAGNGIDFGPASGYNLRSRFTGLGQRVGNFTTATDSVVGGLKGNVGDTSWQWDAGFTYGHYSQQRSTQGYVYYQGLRDALGPSFLDTDGVVKCGTPGNVIAGCTPINIFDQANPAVTDQLRQYQVTPYYNTLYTLRQAEANANGELFDLPAGAVNLAVGASYRKEYQRNGVDFVAITTDPVAGTCFISQEACSYPLAGGFSVKEAYAELFIPVLKDLPFARALNVTLGSRYSDYSNVGNTTNSKLAVEWRPIDDLLLRGTVSEVFRAPNISELYAGPTGSAPVFADPCIGLDAAQLAAHPHACQNVPVGYAGTGLGQANAVVSGSVVRGIALKPEKGKSFDWGFVYDPHWLDGFSVNLDLWRIYLNDTIVSPVGANTLANACFNTDSATTPGVFCNYITRTQLGDVAFLTLPTLNLGRLDTRGVDFGFKYRLPETSFGNFAVSFDSTYIAQYDVNVAPGLGVPVQHIAGHYDRDFGNYARWRALVGVSWNMGAWDASWRIRYVGPLSVGSRDPSQRKSADGSPAFPAVQVPYGSQVYNNFSVGYNIEPINTRVDVGVDNAFDKQPPLFFQNNVINANTDVNSYDTIGRYYWARVTVKF